MESRAICASDVRFSYGGNPVLRGVNLSAGQKDFLAGSFDEEFAGTLAIPVKALYFSLLAMTALSVVTVIRVVWLILVIALLTIPPYISERYSESLRTLTALSMAPSCTYTMLGLWLSYSFNLTSGATIIMVAAAFFFLSMLLEPLIKRGI